MSKRCVYFSSAVKGRKMRTGNAHIGDVSMCVYTCMIQIIMAKAAGGPKAPKQRGHWDKDGWDEEPDYFETHH